MDAPGPKDVPRPLLTSMRLGADVDGGGAAFGRADMERFLSSSCLKRPKMSSIARSLSSLALSASLRLVGVFARDAPRCRVLPNGPLSSGTRR